jgi:hypothetical protein
LIIGGRDQRSLFFVVSQNFFYQNIGAQMTRTRHLPLYAATYSFAKDVYRIKIKLPKVLKFDLGQEVFSSAIKMLKCVVVANASKEKTQMLSRLLIQIDVHWALLRLLFDLRGISEGEFRVMSERLEEIGKQTQAWLKWQKEQSPK